MPSTSDSNTRWWTGSSVEHLGAQLVVDDEQRRADGVLDHHRLAQQRLQQGVRLVGPAQQPHEPARGVGRAQRRVDVVGVERVGLGEVVVGDERHGHVALVRVEGDAGDPRPPGDARERERQRGEPLLHDRGDVEAEDAAGDAAAEGLAEAEGAAPRRTPQQLEGVDVRPVGVAEPRDRAGGLRPERPEPGQPVRDLVGDAVAGGDPSGRDRKDAVGLPADPHRRVGTEAADVAAEVLVGVVGGRCCR